MGRLGRGACGEVGEVGGVFGWRGRGGREVLSLPRPPILWNLQLNLWKRERVKGVKTAEGVLFSC